MSAMEVDKKIAEAEDWYPTIDAPKKKPAPIGKPARTEKLRTGLTPGTVVIVLAGRFKGKRMLYLKELAPGILLLNGPYSVNKAPLVKMRQSFVIVTSTKIPIPNVDLSNVTLKYFEKPRKAKKDQTVTEFFQLADDEKPKLSDEVIATQKKIDTALQPALNEEMVQYLRTPFTLKAGDRPHLMKF